MTTSPLYISGIATPADRPSDTGERPYLKASMSQWIVALVFMLCSTLWGLKFYPAIVGIIGLIWYTFRVDRYSSVIMLTIFLGGYSLAKVNMLPFQNQDIALGLAVVLWFVMRKPPILKKTLLVLVFYLVSLVVIATFSAETMALQMLTLRNYLVIGYIIVPIAAFAGRDFDIHAFWSACFPYVFIMCCYYICDAFIVPGSILLPIAPFGCSSTFTEFYIQPLGTICRKYPQGLFVLTLLFLPIIRTYRLRWWQWIVVLLAILSTQTFTYISCIVVGLVLFQRSLRLKLRILMVSLVAFLSIFALDCVLPMKDTDIGIKVSTFRIKSTIDQFVALRSAVDDEDLALFASGRLAQIMPKVAIISDEGRQLTGLGFLHPEHTTLIQYNITNEYYTDISDNEEVSTGVEVIPVQIYINVGIIGLIIHLIVFLTLYLLVQRLKHSLYFVSLLFLISWFGLGGFSGLIFSYGELLVALSFAVVILANRPTLPGFEQYARRLSD